MLNHLKPTLKLLRNRIFRCAAACPLGALFDRCCVSHECQLFVGFTRMDSIAARRNLENSEGL